MLELNKDNFKAEVFESAVPALVYFFAPWCGPCKMMLPIVEELAKEAGGKFKIAKINVDESNDLAQEYEIMSIPAFIVFKNGKEVERVMGAQSKEKLLELLK